MQTMQMRAWVDDAREETMVLPLPPVVDTSAVVLLGMLGGGCRPLVLDASAVREVRAEAAPLLEALLRATRDAGFPARMVGAAAALRRALAGRPLAAYFSSDPFGGDEGLFTCPDRDEPGFQPSLR